MDDGDVVVVGGGLAGLVAARRLTARGADVSLFEREPTVGGRVRSTHAEGYTFDRGFQVLFTAYPAVRRELDLDALSLRSFRPGAVIARDGQRSTLADPLGDPEAIVESALNRDVTVRDKLRTLALRRDLAGVDPATLLDGDGADRTTGEYLRDRGFSEKFLENFAAPFYGGITLDRDLGTSARVFEYTFSMLSRGRTAVPAGGMGEVSAQLADRAAAVGVDVETEAAVTAVDAREDGATVELDGESVDADAVVVATDPRAASELTDVSTPTGAKACVTLWFTAPDGLELGTDGRILLNAEDARPNQVVHHTEAAPEYAPEGADVLSATFLGEQDATDAELAAEAHETLASWYPERRVDGLEFHHADRIEFAQFAQPPGFQADLPAVDAPAGRAYLAGDYTRWSSIQGALESGRVAADAVAGDL